MAVPISLRLHPSPVSREFSPYTPTPHIGARGGGAVQLPQSEFSLLLSVACTVSLEDSVSYLDNGHHYYHVSPSLQWSHFFMKVEGLSRNLMYSLSTSKLCMASSGAGPTHFLPHSYLTAWLPSTSVNIQVAPASRSLYSVCPLPRGSSSAHSLRQPPFKATCSDHFLFYPLHVVEAI